MDIFVKKPVLAIVISLLFVLLGLVSALRLPVVQFPVIESSAIEITTRYTGLAANVVQGFVTEPVERAAMSVPGVDYVDSKTVAGQSTVTAWLKINEDRTAALSELTANLNKIRSDLPADAEEPVISLLRADRPYASFYLDVSSDYWKRFEITDYLTRNVVPVLSSIEGVQRARVEGGREPALRIWVDQVRLAGYNLSSQDLVNALASNNVVAAIGDVKGEEQQFNIISNSNLKLAQDFEELAIKDLGGYTLKLKDVARVELGERPGIVETRSNFDERVFLSVWPLPGANEIAIGDTLYEKLEELNAGFPDGLHVGIAFDSTLAMRDSLFEIVKTLGETVLLVGLIVLILMGSFRASLVPLTAIPVSLLGSVAVMYALGFTLNILTILAIVLSVGLVVDDAIVVVENVARHRQQGLSKFQAALKSSKELFSPIIAMTLTLASVFLPIGFVTGLSGSLFREFAFTLAAAVLISGIFAVTLSPIMSAYVASPRGMETRFAAFIGRLFTRASNSYGNLLIRLLNWRAQILTFSFVFALLMIPFFLFSAKELAPIEDQGNINFIVQAPPGSTLPAVSENLKPAIEAGKRVEGAGEIWQVLTANGGFGGIQLSDFFEREQSVQEILPGLFYELSQVSGLKVLPLLLPPLPTAGQFDVELVIKGPDSYENMLNYGYQLVGEAYQSGMFMYADTDLKIDRPLVKLKLNHTRIADLGLTSKDVSDQLSFMLSDQYLNRFDADGKAYVVVPMVEKDARLAPDQIMNLQIKGPESTYIPLSSIASLEVAAVPRTLGKFNQQRSFRILGSVVPGTTKAQALEFMEQKAKQILPAGYSLDYAGISRQIKQEGNSLMFVLLASIAVVYLALSVQFNSFRTPLIVVVGSVPLALSAALLFTFLGFTSVNIYSQIGVITLVGLVAKNAILIVEFANVLVEQGKDLTTAIIESAKTRLRPVIMTTAATVLGHFPLVLVTGPGAEARNSIGIILVAGMVIGTMFTLITLPYIYLLFAPKHSASVDAERNEQVAV
ncbi:multidrug efflux pump [Pseudovibrio denitrificans]|uniref:Multidrug efflux pump n=1 Tax=Pseudovibrio denitrificans TaxID=258256 RepID=A0A1I6YK35_9HYPH|nr:efflux RND transporter permease subunit [Pseudovibrio denitrificans]SFT50846.1 multidrug efflux pump [Pseudovibrio denitrificans]